MNNKRKDVCMKQNNEIIKINQKQKTCHVVNTITYNYSESHSCYNPKLLSNEGINASASSTMRQGTLEVDKGISMFYNDEKQIFFNNKIINNKIKIKIKIKEREREKTKILESKRRRKQNLA